MSTTVLPQLSPLSPEETASSRPILSLVTDSAEFGLYEGMTVDFPDQACAVRNIRHALGAARVGFVPRNAAAVDAAAEALS